jgi:hypothetical protein
LPGFWRVGIGIEIGKTRNQGSDKLIDLKNKNKN